MLWFKDKEQVKIDLLEPGIRVITDNFSRATGIPIFINREEHGLKFSCDGKSLSLSNDFISYAFDTDDYDGLSGKVKKICNELTLSYQEVETG